MIYLDNSATTAVCRAAAEKAVYLMTACFGNPSSLHTLGFRAEQELSTARQIVAAWLGVPPGSLVFTAGGTEANNLALLGGAAARRRAGQHIVTTAVEHSSILASCDELERQGWEVTRVRPGRDGVITPQQVLEACREDTALVSVMLVNNETGARFAVDRMIPGIRRVSPQALIHCDAVQAAGKLSLNLTRMGVDLATVSGHKIHAPKGVGALYIRKGVRILPRSFGGGQEGGLRCGTQAVPAIAAMGAAVTALPPPAEQHKLYEKLRDRLLRSLSDRPDMVFHLPDGGVPYLINMSVPGIRSETMLHFLAEREIYVSSGSACSKGKKSPVLTAMGLPDREIDSALRISFSYENTEEDVDGFVGALKQAADVLVRK